MISFKLFVATLTLILATSDDSTNKTKSTPPSKYSMTYPVKIINVSINRSADDVYHFASNPENFPKWVDFVKSVTRQDDFWIGHTDAGDLKIRFTPLNNLGVIDHEVTLPNGETVNNPMRVVPNNEGCEFIFTLFRMPGRTEKEFNEDANAVSADLQTLKMLIEH